MLKIISSVLHVDCPFQNLKLGQCLVSVEDLDGRFMGMSYSVYFSTGLSVCVSVSYCSSKVTGMLGLWCVTAQTTVRSVFGS